MSAHRERPLLLRDENSTIFACAFPPPSDPAHIEAMREELAGLERFGTEEKGSKRGPFKTVKHGLQMGHGSKVGIGKCALNSS
jgi:hypothetical protein